MTNKQKWEILLEYGKRVLLETFPVGVAMAVMGLLSTFFVGVPTTSDFPTTTS